MNFNAQMLAVIQVIWTMRNSPPPGVSPGRRRLNASSVAKEAKAILVERAPEAEKAKVKLDRQNWLSKNCSAEWKAIRRAIDGDDPLPGCEEVEAEIARFNDADPNKSLVQETARLKRRIAELESVVNDHDRKFEEFRAKAYNEQYVSARFREDVELQQRRLTDALTRSEKLGQQLKEYQLAVSNLTKAKEQLERIVKAKGATKGGKPLHKTFSVDLSKLPPTSDENALFTEYLKAVNDAWEGLLGAADKDKPTDIYIVFHTFNIDVPRFIEAHVPMSPGVLSYVFCCCQPVASRRSEMFRSAATKIIVPPIVFLVVPGQSLPHDSGATVVSLRGPQSVEDRLRARVAKQRGFQPYDPFDEGYHQVWIERTPT